MPARPSPPKNSIELKKYETGVHVHYFRSGKSTLPRNATCNYSKADKLTSLLQEDGGKASFRILQTPATRDMMQVHSIKRRTWSY